jgi:F-type H+-transporting ATPase subunit gamma
MAKTRALVKRRKAIRNIRKITRTMELIATARFKKALDRASQAEAYTRKIGELAANLSASATDVKHPLLEVHPETKNALLLVLTSNRGMCGGYNAGILREASRANQQLKQEGIDVHLEASGKRGIGYFRYHGIQPEAAYTHFEDKPAFDEVDVLAEKYIQAYIKGDLDRVQVVYQKFISASKQTAVVETLLPLTAVSEGPKEDSKETGGRSVEYEFVPAAKGILEEILPESFKVRLFKCFLDAAVSEQIARRVAMKSATENAGDMIKFISRQYNRARQAQITKEIAEVIGGAEALK